MRCSKRSVCLGYLLFKCGKAGCAIFSHAITLGKVGCRYYGFAQEGAVGEACVESVCLVVGDSADALLVYCGGNLLRHLYIAFAVEIVACEECCVCHRATNKIGVNIKILNIVGRAFGCILLQQCVERNNTVVVRVGVAAGLQAHQSNLCCGGKLLNLGNDVFVAGKHRLECGRAVYIAHTGI